MLYIVFIARAELSSQKDRTLFIKARTNLVLCCVLMLWPGHAAPASVMIMTGDINLVLIIASLPSSRSESAREKYKPRECRVFDAVDTRRIDIATRLDSTQWSGPGVLCTNCLMVLALVKFHFVTLIPLFVCIVPGYPVMFYQFPPS